MSSPLKKRLMFRCQATKAEVSTTSLPVCNRRATLPGSSEHMLIICNSIQLRRRVYPTNWLSWKSSLNLTVLEFLKKDRGTATQRRKGRRLLVLETGISNDSFIGRSNSNSSPTINTHLDLGAGTKVSDCGRRVGNQISPRSTVLELLRHSNPKDVKHVLGRWLNLHYLDARSPLR